MKISNEWFHKASPAERKAFVRQMFNSISPTYDLLNRIMSFGIDQRWRKKAVMALNLNRDERSLVLDVAAGTGDMSLRLLENYPLSKVILFDFAEEMLQKVPQRKKFRGWKSRYSLCQGDGEVLPFPDGIFDGIMIAFGLRNFPNPTEALKEFYRVLKPGKKLVILEISQSPHRWFDTLYRFYFHQMVPKIGRWISKNGMAYSYLPRSVENFLSPAEIKKEMEKIGYSSVQSLPLTMGVTHLTTGRKP